MENVLRGCAAILRNLTRASESARQVTFVSAKNTGTIPPPTERTLVHNRELLVLIVDYPAFHYRDGILTILP